MSFIKKYLCKHKPLTGAEKEGPHLACQACYTVAGIVAFFLCWALAGPIIFRQPSLQHFSGFLPLPALQAFIGLLSDPEFWRAVIASLRRVVVGIGMALLLGLPTGLLIGFFRKIRLMTYPPIQFVRMISPLSWMPIALLVFSTFESAIYFLITMATVWPIILNTTLGVSRVNPEWLKMARIQGAKDHQLLLHIILPASIPYILTSLRLAIGVAWIVLVPAEFLGISSGLGYIINDARDTMEYDRLMAIVMAIGVVGFLLDGSVQLMRKAFRWTWV